MRIDGKGLIDRTKPVRFRFDGKDYAGYKGDTLASALLANDVRLVGRSFKYHRPRGVLTAGSEEPNALVEVIGATNQTPIHTTVAAAAAKRRFQMRYGKQISGTTL